MLSSGIHLTKNMSGLSLKMLLCIAFAVLSISRTNGLPSSRYVDAVGLSPSCPDLCKYDAQNSNNQARTCSCDYSCGKFGDCCMDAPRVKIDAIDTKCHGVSGVGGVYMVGHCPETYDGVKDWKEMCEEQGIADPSDPIGTMPVTDFETGATYKNVYCGMCNGRANFTRFWNPVIECPLLPLFNDSGKFTDDFVIRNLARENGAWGLNINQGDELFLDCFVSPAVPPAFEGKVRYCNPELVSDCPPAWRYEEVREKCQSYLGPRFTEDGIGYRNADCAVCNGADLAGLSCQGPDFEHLDIFRFSAAHSFALLMDINERMGSRVGMIRMCENGDVYDPFFKKCRSLQCFPGFVRRGQRCVRPRKFPRKIFRKVSIRTQRIASTNVPFTSTTEEASTFLEMQNTTEIHAAQDEFQGTDSSLTTYPPLSTTQEYFASSNNTSAVSDVTELTSTTDVPSTVSKTASTYSSSEPESLNIDINDFLAGTASQIIGEVSTSVRSSGDFAE